MHAVTLRFLYSSAPSNGVPGPETQTMSTGPDVWMTPTGLWLTGQPDSGLVDRLTKVWLVGKPGSVWKLVWYESRHWFDLG